MYSEDEVKGILKETERFRTDLLKTVHEEQQKRLKIIAIRAFLIGVWFGVLISFVFLNGGV